MSDASGFNEDFLDMFHALVDAGVEFVVVGAHAMAVHGVPRATGDLDILLRPSSANARRAMAALRVFGAPMDDHGVTENDFTSEGTVYQIGLPPRRIDLLTKISGVGFEDAWSSRLVVEVDGLPVPFLGRHALAQNKRAAGRAKDLVDVELLERAEKARE